MAGHTRAAPPLNPAVPPLRYGREGLPWSWNTPTPNGGSVTTSPSMSLSVTPSSGVSVSPAASYGLIVTGSSAWLTSQAKRLPSERTSTSAATRGSSTSISLRTPAWAASAA